MYELICRQHGIVFPFISPLNTQTGLRFASLHNRSLEVLLDSHFLLELGVQIYVLTDFLHIWCDSLYRNHDYFPNLTFIICPVLKLSQIITILKLVDPTKMSENKFWENSNLHNI